MKSFDIPKKENLTGKKAPDFSCNDVNGKKYSLNDFKDKYILYRFLGNLVRSV